MTAAEVPQNRLIHSVKSQMQWPQWFTLAGRGTRRGMAAGAVRSSHMAIDAALDGFGLALESPLMMWRELRDGTLVCPVRNPPGVLTTQWIVCPTDHLHRAKVRCSWTGCAPNERSGRTSESCRDVGRYSIRKANRWRRKSTLS
jgi:DNA-binding transcriptional LysR family regulator